jgi:CRP/FNR family transcriptional regulator, anaerobic regulatory protein
MPVALSLLQQSLHGYPLPLLEKMASYTELVGFPAQTGLMRQGQYVKVVPIVLKGLLRVFTQYQEKELLLYYIKPNESCVMSFTAVLNNDSSHIFAVTEEDSELLLLPAEQLLRWLQEFPVLSNLYHKQYYVRYNELLETIHQLVFEQLDQRLLHYLREKAIIQGTRQLQVLHRQIAADLGSSREVITRTLRKLERDGLVQQTSHGIELL